ncbi:DNA polymerase III polC-type [Rhynchospora pubera]|uniref:DNA polymerase III polC-type n=1 Tax=Rhynchospora pubera TaxID=906938 RepID=A0AAV8DCU7_9POAL|nr:DNA polymerase III polC-type [Rhynchospora pubera]
MSFLSVSFHHFRNCRFSFINIKSLRFYSGKALFDKPKIRPLTTRAESPCERSQNSTPESIKFHISKAEILKPNIEPIRCYPVIPKEGILESKIDRPATIIVLDIETTGFNTPKERIVEFAARNLKGGENSTFQMLINPEKEIRNSHIHGITDSMVNQPGVLRFPDGILVIKEWVSIQQEPGKPVILLAHNGKSFDFPFLSREMDRCGHDIPDFWRFFDTLPLARRLKDSNGSPLKKHSIKDICEFFGIDVEGPAHRAMGDVDRLTYIYQHITFHLKYSFSDLIKESIMASEIKWKPNK